MRPSNSLDRCSRCGRVLRDPTSRALGIGPECRGSKTVSHRQAARANRLQRGQAYVDRTQIIFSNMIYTFDATSEKWVSSKSGSKSTDESLKAWLKKNELAIFPDEYRDSLVYRRDLIIETLNDKNYILSEKERNELTNELYQIQDVLDLENEEETEETITA